MKDEKIIIIDGDYYSLLDEKYKRIIPYWEETSRISLSYVVPIVGITYGERALIVKELKIGESLNIIRQPDNPYDSNAILVVTKDGGEIGFIAKDWAAVFAFKIDCGFTYEVTVQKIETKHVAVTLKTNSVGTEILEKIGFDGA